MVEWSNKLVKQFLLHICDSGWKAGWDMRFPFVRMALKRSAPYHWLHPAQVGFQ